VVHTFTLIPLIQSLYQLRLNIEQVYMCMLLEGHLVPDRSSVITQTKRDILALQFGRWS
jgi:hypothetical protein